MVHHPVLRLLLVAVLARVVGVAGRELKSQRDDDVADVLVPCLLLVQRLLLLLLLVLLRLVLLLHLLLLTVRREEHYEFRRSLQRTRS